MSAAPPPPLTGVAKLRIVLRVWGCLLVVTWLIRKSPLPEVVQRLQEPVGPRRDRIQPRRLGWIVHRVSGIGPFRPRCLILSLAHFRLLRAQGERPELVIGLPVDATEKDAHAWVEIEGTDVGPPPGRRGHQQLARYP